MISTNDALDASLFSDLSICRRDVFKETGPNHGGCSGGKMRHYCHLFLLHPGSVIMQCML